MDHIPTKKSTKWSLTGWPRRGQSNGYGWGDCFLMLYPLSFDLKVALGRFFRLYSVF